MKYVRWLCNYLLRIINYLFPIPWQVHSFNKKKNIAGQNQDGIQIHALFAKRKIAGWVWLTIGRYYSADHYPYGVIYSLGVATVFRRLGIGKTLIAQCLQLGKENGLKELVVLVLNSNKRALLFYNKLGFKDAQKGLYPEQYSLETSLFPSTNYTVLVISTQHKS
ncbi:GNAT family N-acetyltransferase [Saccharicrinis fermentans]|uniref:Putative acetyltransferase n=1 Tax=Saccharicrinis fermentans DSM 9555 = JCM 21142 TaxID=869213 RepID=W7YIT0_9BACT|nr:N-acetyltransferase [Saccharicrinis fermentans]GAF02439.1 putative acetyltransferase [Saccharicrinis fermentans DSM 9555 = JCM 21142]